MVVTSKSELQPETRLKITEIMYNPRGSGEHEFVEIASANDEDALGQMGRTKFSRGSHTHQRKGACAVAIRIIQAPLPATLWKSGRQTKQS